MTLVLIKIRGSQNSIWLAKNKPRNKEFYPLSKIFMRTASNYHIHFPEVLKAGPITFQTKGDISTIGIVGQKWFFIAEKGSCRFS